VPINPTIRPTAQARSSGDVATLRAGEAQLIALAMRAFCDCVENANGNARVLLSPFFGAAPDAPLSPFNRSRPLLMQCW
jgi:hypothetical protein